MYIITTGSLGGGILSVLFLTPAETKILELLSALVERFGVSRMRDLKKKKKILIIVELLIGKYIFLKEIILFYFIFILFS